MGRYVPKEVEVKYPVLWMKLWKKLSMFMSLAISIPVAILFVVRFFKNDMNLEVTFEHITITQLPFFFLGIVAISVAFSFLIAVIFKFAGVEIKGDYLIGRNYWFFKKQIPIKSIEQFYPFSNNGIEAVVADAGSYGKVYISTQTDKLDELIALLETSSGVSGT